MNSIKLIVLFLIVPSFVLAQDSTQTKIEKPWKFSGDFSLLFSQSAFNNEWQNGGTSNYAVNGIINYRIIYKKQNWNWDTKILADYGINRADGQDFARKTSDRFEVNSVAGYKLKGENWYFSFMLNALTQFDRGYEFGKNEETDQETRTLQTQFLSPGFFKFGPGLLWEKSDSFSVNIAPASTRLITANRRFTTVPDYEDGDFFGLDQGETLRLEFGASFRIYGKFTLLENITVENTFNSYLNYLQESKNIDIDYTLDMRLKVNKYISTNITFQAIYDDNAAKGFQIRQVLGVGLSYNF